MDRLAGENQKSQKDADHQGQKQDHSAAPGYGLRMEFAAFIGIIDQSKTQLVMANERSQCDRQPKADEGGDKW